MTERQIPLQERPLNDFYNDALKAFDVATCEPPYRKLMHSLMCAPYSGELLGALLDCEEEAELVEEISGKAASALDAADQH